MSRRPTRRTVLRGLLGGAAVTVGLPPLQCFFNESGTAWADTGGFPKRFGLFFWGNGHLPERWLPLSEGAGYTLSDQLAPLAGVQDLVTVVTGLNVQVPNEVPHGSGAAGLLTGMAPLIENGSDTFAGPSVDQIIAEAIGRETLYSSLQTACSNINGLSYNGPNSRNPPEYSPYAFFERLFGAGFREPGSDAEPDPNLALRRSVLDAVMEDAATVQANVGYEDRLRVEEHLDGVRELELRLARLQEDPPNLEACLRPDAPATEYPDVDGRPQLSAINRAMCDLLAMALACDQTRVFTHFFSQPVSDVLYPGATAGHHDLTHNEPGEQLQVHDIVVQIVAEYAYMVSALAGIAEGDGTLLDHCVVLGTSEVGFARTHSLNDLPILIAGSAGGVLRQGIHYRAVGGENASKMMLSLIRSMDILATEFGTEDARATDGLSGIEV
ncbi:MAG: DUF1552 domain-containing protein [Alphaproteobacteria bacterium]|nr:DUF1552 domain-containing protein [Alphaproteobacteria bacterium]